MAAATGGLNVHEGAHGAGAHASLKENGRPGNGTGDREGNELGQPKLKTGGLRWLQRDVRTGTCCC